jgi:sugar phosphate isomerase/epimerase
LATFGGDVIEAFLKFLQTKRLKNIHISDFGSHESHLFLACGELPMVKLLNTAGRLGYDGMVTLEISPHELPRTRKWLVKMLQHQATFMKMHLRKECNG